MKEFMESLIWISLISAVAYVVLFILITPIIKKKIDASREAKKEEDKLQLAQLNSELFKESPELYIKLNELQQNHRIISLGLKWGWLPFLLIFVVLSEAIDNLTSFGRAPLSAVMIVALIVIPLIIFYSFLFKRALKLNAKISATKLEIAAETKLTKENASTPKVGE